MAGEFDEIRDHRDYTKFVWGAIVVAVLGMLAALGLSNREMSTRSQAEAKHILVKYNAGDPAERQRALETINDLRKRILVGESFEKLAKEYSDDPMTGARGGYLGWADKGLYDKGFEDYVWTGKLNEVSPVITSSFGYHLIVVMNRKLSAADRYDAEVEEKAKAQQPNIEIPPIKSLPQAAPALPQAEPVAAPAAPPAAPPAAAAPDAAATPAPAVTP